jgi:BirA family biotin operon repressor/biotin-[acetyl-CoA-carboxylase] ligase
VTSVLPPDVIDAILRIEGQTFVRQVEWFGELGSTNDYALSRAAEVDLVLPRLIWTGRQTAGRGRGSHEWWSAAGALTFSLLIDGPVSGLPAERWPQVSMVTALAVAETLQQFVPEDRIGLKWPNDVQIDDRKVCGILVEVPTSVAGRLVVGVGLNVANSLRRAPIELQATAVSLVDLLPAAPSPPLVLLEFLHAWHGLTQQLSAGRLNLAERWSPQCVLAHEQVVLTHGHERIEGVCRGITAGGALLLEVRGRLEQFWAGTVRLVDGVIQGGGGRC